MENCHIRKNDFKEEKKVLFVTSFAEFAERYGYYTIQALLIFYIVDFVGFTRQESTSLVGTVLSMVFISAIIGGYIAERLLGYYRSGMLGSVFMVMGSALLAFSDDTFTLYLALSLISTSTGLIKSNMASFIGRFYDKSTLTDGNRDFGFSVFYVGINLGALIALIFADYLKNNYGYHFTFATITFVSFVMMVSFIIAFPFLRKHIINIKIDIKVALKVSALILGYTGFLFFVFEFPIIANFSTLMAFIGAMIILIMSLKAADKKITVFIAGIFFILSIVYWSLYFQIFSSLLLFIDDAVSTDTLDSSQMIGMVSLGIVISGFFIGKVWLYFERKGKAIDDINKFNLGFILLAISFGVILLSIYLSGSGDIKVNAVGFIIAFFILALSDLSLSAIGLSLVTKIAPKGFVSLYMGVWLITLGIGGKLSGFFANIVDIPEGSIMTAKTNMSNGLIMFIAIALVTSIVIFVIRKFINKHID